ncbi:MAG: hypothetical protein CMH36_11705 [Microbacterium sp.]|jgi:hypothetical protein|uniref:DUF4175 domain-containing protein n=1 Tax=Microbacterium ginsengisoli TaxID=400772 RepID=A0A0F0LU04_9MICO|nr:MULTISPECIES: DUF6704 family protein [Microbacterium]MAL07471.1 hypothetical protein [Microbacterium sp.]MCK9914192.1 hypothetical protein [Microbacteriaceae bacterium K1510]KJL35770.1 hypothetical protein RR49_02203 [Microbacterium ginsengisoli]KQS05462.1 hypothetical protein ASF93_00440 [Microbacterium sp. Leaf347]MBN9197466.1 hypothetical protein [Microbacterium ginsengisoli]
MTDSIGDPGHGHSPAAWTAVVIMLVALSIGTVAFYLEVVWLVWASVVLVVVGALVGLVLSRLGWGANGPKYVPKQH